MDGNCVVPFAMTERRGGNDLAGERPEVAHPGPSLTRAEPTAISACLIFSRQRRSHRWSVSPKYIAMRLSLDGEPSMLDLRQHATMRLDLIDCWLRYRKRRDPRSGRGTVVSQFEIRRYPFTAC